jgi:hypothetical protein
MTIKSDSILISLEAPVTNEAYGLEGLFLFDFLRLHFAECVNYDASDHGQQNVYEDSLIDHIKHEAIEEEIGASERNGDIVRVLQLG